MSERESTVCSPGSNSLASSTKYDSSSYYPLKELWTPFFLTRKALYMFLGIFVFTFLSSLAFYLYSENVTGIATVNSNYYYLWTYGPTAVFTVIASLWGQLEYRALQLMPWLLMDHGPATAEDTVLLDYVSNWNVVALFKSWRRRHFMVSLAVSGALVLKLLTILSTGLFVAKPLEIKSHTNVRLMDRFSDNGFDPYNVSFRLHATSYGIFKHNLRPPSGTEENRAFQTFYDFSNDNSRSDFGWLLPNSTYEAFVDVLTPTLTCEKVSITTEYGKNETSRTLLHSRECNAVIHNVPNSPLMPDRKTMLVLDRCKDADLQLRYKDEWKRSDYPRGVDWRLWIYNLKLATDDRIPRRSVANSAAVCKLEFKTAQGALAMTRDPVTDLPGHKIAIMEEKDIPGISNISGSDILLASFFTALQDQTSSSLLIDGQYLLTMHTVNEYDYSDIDSLIMQATAAMNLIATQVTKSHLMSPTQDTTRATVTSIELRLCVRKVAFALIEAGICVLIGILLLLGVLYMPCKVCSRDPGSIGALSTILAQSPYFCAYMKGTGHMPMRELGRKLHGQRFHTATNSDGAFYIHRVGPPKPDSDTETPTDPQWWRPFPLSLSGRVFTTAVPLALVIALEILLRRSNDLEGVLEVSASDDVRYVWAYLPALVMLGVNTLFGLVHFYKREFRPYDALRRAHASAKESVLKYTNRQIASVEFLYALLNLDWILAAATISVIFAPFLPIVVSGLYTPQQTDIHSFVSLRDLTSFNLTQNATLENPMENVLGGMILHANVSYPQWTYKELAFSRYALAQDTLKDPREQNSLPKSGFLVASIHAYRANTNCSLMSPDHYSLSKVNDTRRPSLGILPNSNDIKMLVNITDPSLSACGSPTLSTFKPVAMAFFSGWGKFCDHPVTYYGVTSKDAEVDHINVLMCQPYIEQVEVDVRLNLPSYEFDKKQPQQTTEHSATRTDQLKLDIGSLLGTEYFFLNISSSDPKTRSLDAIYQSIIYGLDGTPPDALLKPDILISGLKRVYGIVLAQILSQVIAKSSNGNQTSNGGATINSTYVDPFHTRLVQSSVSTRILQGLLALMTASCVLSLIFIKTREILPNNPCSIAAIASMLAGSRLLDKDYMPRGSEWHQSNPLEEKTPFKDKYFLLDWIVSGEKKYFRIDTEKHC